MFLAYVMTQTRGTTDVLLTQFSQMMIERGNRLVGVAQTNTECADQTLCDMDVLVLPDGPTIRISQSLGKGAKGCRLDPAALEQAVALVSAGLDGDPQLLVVNKFGKHEAEGRGFRPVIGEALSRGVPVLAGVNSINEAAFVEFTEGLGQRLDGTTEALEAWFSSIEADTAQPA
ncbi:MAG: DUF2478 domain-containing protein [Rhodobacteraceae bacterium]|nr:DUF2478 domain-containing protein [Paracoccaceae bacterium]